MISNVESDCTCTNTTTATILDCSISYHTIYSLLMLVILLLIRLHKLSTMLKQQTHVDLTTIMPVAKKTSLVEQSTPLVQ